MKLWSQMPVHASHQFSGKQHSSMCMPRGRAAAPQTEERANLSQDRRAPHYMINGADAGKSGARIRFSSRASQCKAQCKAHGKARGAPHRVFLTENVQFSSVVHRSAQSSSVVHWHRKNYHPKHVAGFWANMRGTAPGFPD